MGAKFSRQNANVEEADIGINHAYKFPPRNGNYFGSHFIMGGERFDTPQPEAYLFGENADLNFLGNRPAPKPIFQFPYPPPQANEPTKTLKSLVNIRKESVRFVKAPDSKSNSFNIEFIFDADARCAITIYYFCSEETAQHGVSFSSRDSALTSETFHYDSGVNQLFSQCSHIFNPNLFAEDDLSYNSDRDVFPVVIHCVAEEETRQSHSTICVIDRHPDGIYALRAMKQKIYIDGLCYLLQEIYGIENKNINRTTADDDTEDSGSECVICMSDTRDTLILPCRHLCLCNSCADSLRYQANNCPICRAPFRALLQIRAVQKTVTTGNNAAIPPSVLDGSGDNIPAGYTSVSLIEALNGPVTFVRNNDQDNNDNDLAQAIDILNKHSDKKVNSPKFPDKLNKEKLSQNTPEFRMSVLLAKEESVTKELLSKHSPLMNRAPLSRDKNPREKGSLRPQPTRDCVKIINEKNLNSQNPENDDDSDAEKLSPLLNSKMIISSSKEILGSALHIDGVEESIDDTDTDLDEIDETVKQQKKSRPVLAAMNTEGAVLASAEDSDYYTPEDPHTTILSPLFPNDVNLEKKDSLKNTSSPLTAIKESATSLPDSPISSTSATTRSSGDSYSSSSSTRHLLGSIPVTEIRSVDLIKSNDDNPKSIGNTVNV